MGEFREVATAVGGGPDCLSKVLLRGGSSGVTIWGRYLGSDGIYSSKTRGIACGIPTTGDRAEYATDRENYWQRVVAESVLQEEGTKSLYTYIGKRQATMSEWVALQPIFEVCTKDMG